MTAVAAGAKAGVLEALGALFDRLARDPVVPGTWPGYRELHRALERSRAAGDPEEIEDAVARIYCLLHGEGGAYDPAERRELDRLGGYWCHAGGLAPLALAGPYIGPETRLADYGAGNGLQGLLLQHLYPHRLTTLIEIGGPMIEQGRLLRGILGVPSERVRWVHGCVTDVPPREFDVIYLYRPLRPAGPGRAFYESFARAVAAAPHPVTIVSVADCLRTFLPPSFEVFHDDGQLTGYRRA